MLVYNEHIRFVIYSKILVKYISSLEGGRMIKDFVEITDGFDTKKYITTCWTCLFCIIKLFWQRVFETQSHFIELHLSLSA